MTPIRATSEIASTHTNTDGDILPRPLLTGPGRYRWATDVMPDSVRGVAGRRLAFGVGDVGGLPRRRSR